MAKVLTGNGSCCNAGDYRPGSLKAKHAGNLASLRSTARELAVLQQLNVVPDHFADQIGEQDARLPAKLLARLGRVAQQDFDFGGPEEARINLDKNVAVALVHT